MVADNNIGTIAAGAASGRGRLLLLLRGDAAAMISLTFLAIILGLAIVGPFLVQGVAGKINLGLRNAPPFSAEGGWLYILGADPLGRSVVARLFEAARNTVTIALSAVALSVLFGGALGLLAGYARGFFSTVIMRVTDIVMGFPSLLLAVVVLYIFEPGLTNVILVLAITRLPIYIRTVRSEVLELRERMFVNAARTIGASSFRIMWRHILPLLIPTLLTLGTVEFALVMLSESALSFLGIGLQPPQISLGLMVAEGRAYINSAWWLCFFPGLVIMLTAIAANQFAMWLRLAMDPEQRWRLERLS